jgi:hypothetical protein
MSTVILHLYIRIIAKLHYDITIIDEVMLFEQKPHGAEEAFSSSAAATFARYKKWGCFYYIVNHNLAR